MALLFWRKKEPPPPAEACEPELDNNTVSFPAQPRDQYRRGPLPALWLKSALRPLENLFDAGLGEHLNPVYKSGTLAVMFLALATLSGVVLIFYYKLSDPYGSILGLQNDPWMGRWMRAFHRYVSDATVVATGLHLLRMLAEGKAWGPRALAWISGVVLTGAVVMTAYTGFVMVWDQHGLELARSGARVADLLPIFAEPLSRAFMGASAPMPSFFFMNLFLHVAIPLGILFLLWLHTSKLARSSWLPERKSLWLWGLGLLGLAIVFPVPLGNAADTLALEASYVLDPYFSPWLPFSLSAHPLATLVAGLGAAAFMVSLPWLWRPPQLLLPLPSHNDESRCQGCVTCVTDCPFEAISMVPREQGQGSAMVARVDASLCVSCGLCVASCDRLSIGPADRIGTRQMAAIQALGRANAAAAIVLIDCGNSDLGAAMRAEAQKIGLALVPFTVDCVGDLHPFSVRALQQHFRGVVVLSCPTAACQMREGASLTRERLLEKREPADKAEIEGGRLRLIQMPLSDQALAWHTIHSFAHSLGLAPEPRAFKPASPALRLAKGLALGLPLLGLLGLSAAFKAGSGTEQSELRLAWRLPGQKLKKCRDRNPEELASLPAHMRRKQDCSVHRLSYRLVLSVDGKEILNRKSEPKGAHGDSPLNIDAQIALLPGRHSLAMSYVPDEPDEGQGARLKYSGQVEFKPGRAALLALNGDGKSMEILDTGR